MNDTRFFFSRNLGLGICLLAAGALTGCSDSSPGEITESRQISESEGALMVDATSAQRFRYEAVDASSTAGKFAEAPAPAASDAPSGSGGGGAALKWDGPESWKETPGSSMRDINYTFGPNGEGECYVARLPGGAGGLASNVNRWRKQMGQAELEQAEIDALPTREVFGMPASFVSVDGSFTGMGGAGTIEDARLLGAILMTPNGALFVKMTGPRELVTANEAKFDAFCKSLRLE